MKWHDCKTTVPSLLSDIGKAIVLYSIESSNSKCANNVGYKLYDWTEARWNGIEWRTDDFGLTDKENLFDNPRYKPVAWAEVETLEEFNVYNSGH